MEQEDGGFTLRREGRSHTDTCSFSSFPPSFLLVNKPNKAAAIENQIGNGNSPAATLNMSLHPEDSESRAKLCLTACSEGQGAAWSSGSCLHHM